MPDFSQFVTAMREQMNANLSRSDVLRPLSWLIGILLTALVSMTWAKAPDWMLISFAILAAFLILLYAAAYAFFAVKDRDALRSERYTLNKMAIEHGLLGDSTSGIVEIEQMKPSLKPFDRSPMIENNGGKK